MARSSTRHAATSCQEARRSLTVVSDTPQWYLDRAPGPALTWPPQRFGVALVDRLTRFAAASADQHHELPAHVTVLADAVRLRDVGEREGLHDREPEAPGRDQLADSGECVDRPAGVTSAYGTSESADERTAEYWHDRSVAREP